MAALHLFRLSIAALVLYLGVGAPWRAHAQVSLNATVESDYRFRGVSLTGGEPNLRLGVGYDHAGGSYGGVSAVFGDGGRGGGRALGHVAYLGYARRAAGGLTWDVGVTNARIMVPVKVAVPGAPPYYAPTTYTRRYHAAYTEVYVGLIKGDLSAHLYLSPDYLGGAKTAYLDLNGAMRLADRLRWTAHAGVITALEGRLRRSGGDTRFDLRTGLVLELPHAEVQLSGVWASRAEYPIGYRQDRTALTASATVFF